MGDKFHPFYLSLTSHLDTQEGWMSITCANTFSLMSRIVCAHATITYLSDKIEQTLMRSHLISQYLLISISFSKMVNFSILAKQIKDLKYCI